MTDEIKTQEQTDDETYKANEYEKKQYSISKEEMAELQPLEDVTKLVQTQLAIGQIAQRAKDNYVATKVLTRLGIKESTDSKFNYDLVKGQVIVYEPRFWCSQCQNKKAEYKYKEKNYCKACIDMLKTQEVKKIEPEAVKAEVKKEPKKK